MSSTLHFWPGTERCRVGIGRDQAGIDGKPFAIHQAFGHAAAHYNLDHMAQEVALPEAAARAIWLTTSTARKAGELARGQIVLRLVVPLSSTLTLNLFRPGAEGRRQKVGGQPFQKPSEWPALCVD
jgi:hypothetical protein